MTLAGTTSVVLLVIAAALCLYLVIALLDPDRF
ncbi:MULTISPECIES: K(+)-transporting ATPase subunit F [unclassified Rhodococcus (in: high G+C Gram-positive bacteria)]|nr:MULTISPECIES: K(+)-transporting ATPase subunit F [unclassified Rhodococcus (in: high G+C Gram-positive bacteria)]